MDQLSEKDNQERGNSQKTISIKLKLLGVLVPAVIGIIALIILNIYQSTSRIIVEKSEEILSTSTESVVNKVNAWMNETLTALNVQRDTLEYFTDDESGALDYIKHTENMYASFPSGIYVGTTEAHFLHASFVPDADFNVFEKTWYQDGLKSEQFIFGPVYLDTVTKENIVSAYGALKDKNGTVKGAVSADIYLTAISDIVKEIRLEETGAMFLVDSSTGIIIGHRDQERAGTLLKEQKESMYPYVAGLIEDKAYGMQAYTAEDGSKIYLQLDQVPGSEWITVAYVPHAEIMSDLNSLTRSMIMISICGILILLILMERLIHIIIKPVKKLNTVVGAMSNGDFTRDIRVKTRDEIGGMARGVHRFISVMRSIISQIMDITAVLNKQSMQSTEVAENLSQSSAMQSQSMEEMNRTIEELTHSIMEVAENATSLSLLVNETNERGTQAGEMITGAVKSSVQGREDMAGLLVSMDGISQKVRHLEQSSGHMAESIKQINSMVDFIRDIAEETNLLSLNASIEAARAGESGRGFAIVAGQIGKLAANSKNAVDDISGLTSQIGTLVSQTVEETKDSVSAITAGSDIVNQTEASFRNIYDSVNRTDESVRTMIEKIQEVNMIATSLAGITQQQSAASEEILATVETLKENARNVSGSSNTVAEDADKLRQNAALLAEQLRIFKIDQTGRA